MRRVTPPRTMAGVADGIRGLGYGTLGGAIVGAFGALALGNPREVLDWVFVGALVAGLGGFAFGVAKR